MINRLKFRLIRFKLHFYVAPRDIRLVIWFFNILICRTKCCRRTSINSINQDTVLHFKVTSTDNDAHSSVPRMHGSLMKAFKTFTSLELQLQVTFQLAKAVHTEYWTSVYLCRNSQIRCLQREPACWAADCQFVFFCYRLQDSSLQ